MSDRLDEFGDAAVVLVTFTRPRNLRGFRRQLGLAYPVVADETRSTYRAYGLGRGSWRRVWGFPAIRGYARLLRRGKWPHFPTGDTLQLGGDFIVDSEGLVAYAHPSTGPDDRPAVDELLAVVRAIR